MLKFISSAIKLAHSLLITYLCINICGQSSKLCPQEVLLQIGFSILCLFASKKHFLDVLQVVISLFLTYSLIPNNYNFLVGLFFFKIIYVSNVLGEVVQDLFATTRNKVTKLLKILVSLLRYTVVEYLFLGLVLLGYKLWTLNDPQGSLPEDYIIFYKLIVTATTIGYGDVTPKTKHQISYFTYFIPFICASFVLYFNAVIPLLGDLTDILLGNDTSSSEDKVTAYSKIQSLKIWNEDQKASFTNFEEEVTKRYVEDQEQKNKLGYNWIALSARNFQRQIPLLNQILRGDQSKQTKLKVCSKVRKLFFPANWIILQAGDSSADLMMVDEGEVRTTKNQGKGFVFNKEGFLKHTPSKVSFIASTFVSVWAINRSDLQQIGKTSVKIQQIIGQALKL